MERDDKQWGRLDGPWTVQIPITRVKKIEREREGVCVLGNMASIIVYFYLNDHAYAEGRVHLCSGAGGSSTADKDRHAAHS